MEKELKSCTGVLLRADLTRHGQKGWDGRAQLDQPSKGHRRRILILLPKCSTTLYVPHIKKLETFFTLDFHIMRNKGSLIYFSGSKEKNLPHSKKNSSFSPMA